MVFFQLIKFLIIHSVIAKVITNTVIVGPNNGIVVSGKWEMGGKGRMGCTVLQ